MIQVLLVDDERDLLDVTRLFLERGGTISVATAISAREALAMLSGVRFDVIVSDFDMPEINGIEFLKRLRNSGDPTPFIIFTGKGREYVVIEALNYGADFYLQKGGDPKAQFAELGNMIVKAHERRIAEEALKESERQYRSVVEDQTELICRFLKNGIHVFVNEAYCRYFGKKREEIIGHRFRPAIPPEDRPAVDRVFRSLSPDHPVASIDHRIVMPDGQERWQRWVDRGIFDDSGTIIEYQSVGRDITERIRTEEALRHSEKTLSEIIDFLPDATFAIDRDHRVIAWNRAIEEMTGVPAVEMLGKGDYEYAVPFYGHKRPILVDLVASEHAEIAKGGYDQVRKEGPTVMAETSRANPRGRALRLWVIASTLYDEKGQVSGAIESIRDISRWHEAEQVREESEERFRDLANLLPVVVFEMDMNFRITFMNNVAYTWFGFDEEMFAQGISAVEWIDPADSERAVADLSNVLSGKIPLSVHEYPLFMIRKDGTRFPASIYPSVIFGKNGKDPKGLRGVIIDNSERNRVIEALSESEERFRTLANLLPVTVFEMDLSGRLTYLNRVAEEWFGHSVAGLPDTYRASDSFAPADRERVLLDMTNVLSGKQPPREAPYKASMVRKDGSLFPATLYPSVVFGKDSGKPIGMRGVIIDNSDEERIIGALQESEERFRTLANLLPVTVLELDTAAHLTYLNRVGTEWFGHTVANVPKDYRVFESVAPFDRDRVREDILGVLSGKQPPRAKQYKTTMIRKDGSLFPATIYPSVVYGKKSGKPVGMRAVLIDNSDEERFLEAIQKSEERFRTLADLLPVTVFEMDRAGRLRFVNRAAFEWFGYSREEFEAGIKAVDVIAVFDRERVLSDLQKVYSGNHGRMGDYTLVRKDGSSFPASIYPSMIAGKDGSPDGLRGVVIDNTERERAMEALRMSEERIRTLADLLPVTIFELDQDGKLTFANRVAFEWFGYSQEEFAAGLYAKDLISPEDAGRAMEDLVKVFGGADIRFVEYDLRRKDGSEFPATIYVSVIAGKAGEPPAGIRGVVIDNSEREKVMEALLQANRKLNLLNSVTRHDVLNQLTILHGYLELSQDMVTDPTLVEFMTREVEAADAIRRQVRFTRDYQDIGVRAPQWQSAEEVCRKAWKGLGVRESSASLGIDPSLSAITIFADPLLEKVFSNLFDNAIKHSGKETTHIRVSCTPRNDDLVIVCEDDGNGVKPEEKERIFERGFGKNSGYGLFLVREILSITGLSITETGTAGQGARFEILVGPSAFRKEEPAA